MSKKCILMLGDICDTSGKAALTSRLKQIIDRYQPVLVIANGENITGGYGINVEDANFLYNMSVDVITLGNHAYSHKEVYKLFEDQKPIIAPANLLITKYEHGFLIITKFGIKFGVINILGSAKMSMITNHSINTANDIVNNIKHKCDAIIIDMHSSDEAEKYAMAYFFAHQASNNKVIAVIGTHMHFPTSDGRIINNRLAFQTDIGMCGNYGSPTNSKKFKTLCERYYLFENSGMEDYVPHILKDETLCCVVIYIDTNNLSNIKATAIRSIIYSKVLQNKQ